MTITRDEIVEMLDVLAERTYNTQVKTTFWEKEHVKEEDLSYFFSVLHLKVSSAFEISVNLSDDDEVQSRAIAEIVSFCLGAMRHIGMTPGKILLDLISEEALSAQEEIPQEQEKTT